MSKVQLQILGLSYSQTQDNAYVLILVEDGSDKRMPIIIGGAEAQAIAIELESMKAPRPLTHDLFKTLANSFEITLDEVMIYKLEEGIFYSRIVVSQNGKTVEIDSRTSDAVALAVRFECPIYTTQDVLEKAGIVLDVQKEKPTVENDDDIVDNVIDDDIEDDGSAEFLFVSDEDLVTLLDEAIAAEDYEKASQIRDEINARKEED